jgi:ComF family protein
MHAVRATTSVNDRLVPIRRTWRQLAGALLDVVLPPACSSCGAAAEVLCGPCRRRLVKRRSDGCVRCGAVAADGGRSRCDHRHLRHISQLIAPYRFVGTAGCLVRRFKLGGDAAAGRWLARAMADAYRACGAAGRPLVLSVPLHRVRRRRRGFDQAAWLALGIAKRLGLRTATGVLVRTRATRPQGDAFVLSRTANVRGAFAVRGPEFIRGRSLLLIDDVFTTGATARACAKSLKDAGARSVSLLVACES